MAVRGFRGPQLIETDRYSNLLTNMKLLNWLAAQMDESPKIVKASMMLLCWLYAALFTLRIIIGLAKGAY